MRILSALTLGQLQTFNHMLMVMESQGLFNLAEARVVVSRETEWRHKHRQSRSYAKTKRYVPPGAVLCDEDGCEGVMMPYNRVDPIIGGKVALLKCNKCAFSRIVEGQ